MSGNRAFLLVGTALAAGGGYYLYTAGGDPKLAEKKLEADASRISSKIKSELPGKGEELKQDAKSIAEQAKSVGREADKKIYSAYDSAKAEANSISAQAKQYTSDAEAKARSLAGQTESKLDEARAKTGTNLKGAVDSFDKTVEEGASKTKSTISSWFGGK